MKAHLLAVALTVAGCKVDDPLYCEDSRQCTDPVRPYCDVEGSYPASEGIGRTCIADPFAGEIDAGAETPDAAFPPRDAAVADAGACSWRRLAPLANVNSGTERNFVGSLDAEGTTLHFARTGQFFRAERDQPDEPFRAPVPLDFESKGFLNPEVSPSGLELFYADINAYTIGRATRTAVNAAFGARDDDHLRGISPSLSDNGLSLYYVESDNVMRVTRRSVGSAWGEPELVIDTEDLFFDVDVSPDERRLLLLANPLDGPTEPLLIAERSSLDVEFGEPVPVDPAILFPDDSVYAYASWTGDGRQLIVSVARDGDDTEMYFATCE